jgi:glutaminyl-tRNA synthetase
MGPPKAKVEPAATGPMIDQFKAFGLSQAKAAEAAKTPKSAGILKILLEDPSYGLKDRALEEKQAVLVAAFAVQLSKTDIGVDERAYVLRAVESGRLKSVEQVTGESVYHYVYTNTDSR